MTPAEILRRFDKKPATAAAAAHLRRGDHTLSPESYEEQALIPAAVLIPLIDRPAGLSVMLTRRTAHLAHHAGQISFPGGHAEPEETPEETAIRETEEEVGLAPNQIQVAGRLETYVTRTGFEVVPVVGLVTPPFNLQPDGHEVAEVFEVPLAFFLDPANHRRDAMVFKGKKRYFYAMPYGDYYVWGATAGMLVSLYEFLRP